MDKEIKENDEVLKELGYTLRSKIGDTNIRTNIWYKVNKKENLPFGNHVEEVEKEKCTAINIHFDLYKNNVFNTYTIDFEFFIDSRECGIGGYLYNLSNIKYVNIQKEYKKAVEETSKIIKTLDLNLDVKSMDNKINGLKDKIKQLEKEIKFLGELKNE